MADTVEKKTVFTLESRIEGYLSNLVTAQRATKESTDQIVNHFGKIGGGINSLIGITGTLTGILAGGAAFKSIVSETVSWTLETAKLAKTLGTTTQEASVFKVALHSVGVDQEIASSAALRMAKTLNTGSEAFKAIGVDVDAMRKSGASNIEMMVATVQALGQYKGGLDRNQMAMQIFSRSWGEVQQLMKLTPAIMEEARETAQRLHLVVGSEGVAAAAEYKKAIRELNLVQESLKIQIGKEMIPVLRDLGVAFGAAGVAAASGFGSSLRYVLRQIAETKLQYTIALKELGVMMDGGPLGSNWFTKKGRAEITAEIDTLEQMYQHGMETIADRYGDINHALPPTSGGKTAPDAPKPAAAEDPALAKENQYIQTYNRLQDERSKGAIQGNALLSETDKKLAELALKYQDLIQTYPNHRAELERNMALDKEQIRNLAALKKAEEERIELQQIYAEMERDELENGLMKSDAYLNAVGKISDSQQARLDQSSMISTWAARNSELDRNAEKVGRAFMSGSSLDTNGEATRLNKQSDPYREKLAEGNPEIDRLNDEFNQANEHWAKMVISEEEYLRRRTQLEQVYSEKRVKIEQSTQDLQLGAVRNYTSAAMNLTNALSTFAHGKSRTMFQLNKVAGIANATVATYEGAAKAMKDVPYPYNFAAAASVIAAGLANVASISSTSFESGGGAAAGGTGAGTATSPVVTQPAAVVQTPQQGSVTVNIIGDHYGTDKAQVAKWWEETVVPVANEAASRNVTINVTPQ